MSARSLLHLLLRGIVPVVLLAALLLPSGCAVGVGPDYVAFGDPYRGVYRHPYWAGPVGPYYHPGYYYRGPRGWGGYTEHVARYGVDYAARGMAVRVR